jgi:hypothetical protein
VERLESAAEQLEERVEDLLHLPHFRFQQHSQPPGGSGGSNADRLGAGSAAQDTTDVNIPDPSLLANRDKRAGGKLRAACRSSCMHDAG